MGLDDIINKVLYIKDEDKYYYFCGKNIIPNYLYFGTWDEDEMPKNSDKCTRSYKIAWEQFLERQKDLTNLVILDIKDFKQVSVTQQTLLRQLFTGWIL